MESAVIVKHWHMQESHFCPREAERVGADHLIHTSNSILQVAGKSRRNTRGHTSGTLLIICRLIFSKRTIIRITMQKTDEFLP